MGLDNIPREYPCKKANTAIMTGDKIDCDATQEADQCPWKKEFKKFQEKYPDVEGTIGMFGVSCWYRGKYGQWLLSILDNQDDYYHHHSSGFSFYGDNEEGFDSSYAKAMALFMQDNVKLFKKNIRARSTTHDYSDGEVNGMINDYQYAAWWLKFVAEYADGSIAWW